MIHGRAAFVLPSYAADVDFEVGGTAGDAGAALRRP